MDVGELLSSDALSVVGKCKYQREQGVVADIAMGELRDYFDIRSFAFSQLCHSGYTMATQPLCKP